MIIPTDLRNMCSVALCQIKKTLVPSTSVEYRGVSKVLRFPVLSEDALCATALGLVSDGGCWLTSVFLCADYLPYIP